MLKDAKRLHNFGFAIHWLHPNSKRPLESGWTKGPRKEWAELKDAYKYGLNMGVRLGRASKLSTDKYLSVIDCDVKSDDEKHTKEMERKLVSVFGKDILISPTVVSGRGNGSRHIYVQSAEPVKPKRISQSSEKVRVQMPSVKASRSDEEALNPDEIAEGFRMRVAWEISLMGEGQQVVLPPSVHPDTGNTYEWARPLESAESLPTLDPKFLNSATEKKSGALQDFEAVEVQLLGSALPDKYIAQIVSGDGVADRSGALFGVTCAMLRAKFSDNEILSVLTDPENFLGQAAYDHAQTESRKRAAEWLRKYTLEKAKHETLAENQFTDAVVDEVPLSDEEAKAQAERVTGGHDWREKIERSGDDPSSRPKPTLINLMLILQGECGAGVFKRDDFANSELYGCSTEWGGREGQEIKDIDILEIKKWFAQKYRIEPANDKISEAVSLVAAQNRFHPVRDFLDTLEWDGVGRLNTWLKTYLGAEGPEPYMSDISRKVICGMVARAYEPGVKYDQVMILEGPQGCGKSTAVRILGDPWFSDAHINIGDKDTVLTMRSVWVMELGELSGMRKADVDHLKEFISQRVDRIRNPYGKRAENFPRQCVFIATTNSGEYLKDMTGNRRFWPAKVGACRFDDLKRDRDQLLAEAKFCYELGEFLDLENPESLKQAFDEQDARAFHDVWADEIENWLKLHPDFREKLDGKNGPESGPTSSDFFGDFGPLAGERADRPNQMRLSAVLRGMGYTKMRSRSGGQKRYHWVKTEIGPTLAQPKT